jgi:YfiH family protein
LTDIREVSVAGLVPRYEIPGWREQFGVVAGITGRGEGVKPFDLGLWTSEAVGEVMGRWRDVQRIERGFDTHVLGNQVHQTTVAWTDGSRPGWTLIEGVDGHATPSPGVMLYATVADCIPVYLLDPANRVICLLHAGWRGTAGGIVTEGIRLLMRRVKSSPVDFVMHCGIGICGECYEVGSEVMDGLGLTRPGNGPFHADLRNVIAEQARTLGVREITVSGWCSAHDHDRFFSHRASGGTDGRMVAYLGLVA